jgi:hypothetical protein
MRRRRVVIVSLMLLVPLLALGGYAEYGRWRDFSDRNGLFVNCYSDRLNHIAFAFENAASERDGRLAGQADIVARLDADQSRTFYTTCAGCGQPFVWNGGIDQLDVRTAGPVALVWCPPGSHGKHVGAIVVENGKFETRMMTLSELSKLQQSPGR